MVYSYTPVSYTHLDVYKRQVRDLSVLPSAEETGPNFFFLPKEEMA